MKRESYSELGFILAVVLLMLSFAEADPVVTDLQRVTGVVCLLASSGRKVNAAE
ncbi:MAG: hypothetical protein ACKOYP_09000 [Bacteroidota bacterium]